MSTFRHLMAIGDPQGQRFEDLQALVDTGASLTMVPGSVLRRLGVPVFERRVLVLGDGRRMECDVGETRVRIDGKALTRLVVFADERAPTVIGADTLQGFGLAVDPTTERLVPAELFG